MNYTHMATAKMDQHVRNTMSIMAWGMAALCAWVMLLSVHVLASNVKAADATVYAPATMSDSPR